MSLINCKIHLDLNWSKKCVILATNVANQAAIFSIAGTRFYVPVVTLPTQKHLKSGLKRTINLNKYQSKISTERPN